MASLVQNADQDDINRFLMSRLGQIPQEAFFNPENISRVMEKARMIQ